MSISAKLIRNYQVEIKAGSHTFYSDEPKDLKGDDTGPTPMELFLSSLAGCKVITVQMYAQRKGWDLQGMNIQLTMEKKKASEVEGAQSAPNKPVTIIESAITFEGDLDEDQIKRMLTIADKCPVHKVVTGEVIMKKKPVPQPQSKLHLPGIVNNDA